MNARRSLAGVALFVLLALGCADEDPTFDNPFDPRNGEDLPIPTAIDVFVGSNVVRLTWQLPEGESADEYAIFRARLDDAGIGEQLVARLKTTTYDDSSVRNGVPYAYRIAAGRMGRFGTRSEAIEVRPNVISIIIADDAPKTRLRSVAITATAPTAVTVKLSETPDPSTAQPRNLTPALTWTLSTGDGNKQLYAVFQLVDGSESVPVSDTIVLDTRAVIRAVSFDAPAVRTPGDTVHFTLDAGEPDGNAAIQVSGLFDTPLKLFDDGTNGDAMAGDGVYELDVVLPGRVVSNAAVTGRFTDDVGNEASPLDGAKRLSVQEGPDAVELVATEAAEPPDAAAVTLRWTQFQGTNFASYRVFRSEMAPVDSSKKLVRTENSIGTVSFTDTDVVEGRTYHYRVYVVGTSGLMSGSNTMLRAVPNVRPPAAVTIEPINSIGPNSIVVRWSRSPDRDFAAYRLYRNELGAVGENDSLIALLADVDVTSWDDAGLVKNTAYYYRVFTVDTANLTARSTEASATTSETIVPDAVSLLVPTLAEPPEPPSVTLRWTQATESKFASYRVVRADAPPVEDSDELVALVTSRTTLEHVDATVVEGRSYAYRVFVRVNSGEQSGSNTLTVDVPNLRAPAPVTLETPDAAAANRLAIRWTANRDPDFGVYILFRNETGAVSDTDLLLTAISNRSETFFDDTGLVENTKYYYRVYTRDTGSLRSRSNEVSATTKNEPPAAVALSSAAFDSTSATLTWDQSAAHDFASYRLYRNTNPTVTTSSTLVIEIAEFELTSYRDTDLDSATEYSYRVFVVDDGVDPGSKSTGSNIITLMTD